MSVVKNVYIPNDKQKATNPIWLLQKSEVYFTMLDKSKKIIIIIHKKSHEIIWNYYYYYFYLFFFNYSVNMKLA